MLTIVILAAGLLGTFASFGSDVEQPLGQLCLYDHVKRDWGHLVDFGVKDGRFVVDLTRARKRGHSGVTFVSRSIPPENLIGGDAFMQVEAKGLKGKVSAMFEGRTKRGAHFWVARSFNLGKELRTCTMVRRIADELEEIHLRIDVKPGEDGKVEIARIVYGKEDGSHRECDPRVWRKPRLLFHAPFDGTPDAVHAAGNAIPVIAENLSYATGVKGMAVEVARTNKGVLAYAAERNVDPERGAVAFWMKRNWPDRGVRPDKSRIMRGAFGLGRGGGRGKPGTGAVRAWFDGTWARFDSHDDDDTILLDGTFPMDDAWHHVIFNWDDEGASVYLDGKPIRGIPDDYSPVSRAAAEPKMLAYSSRKTFERFFVGGVDEHCPLDARIDEFMVFSSPLGIAEAASLYRDVTPVAIDVSPSYAWEGSPVPLSVSSSSPIGRSLADLSYVICDAKGNVVRNGLCDVTDFPAGQYWVRMTDGESFFGRGSFGVLKSGHNPYEGAPSRVPGVIDAENLELVADIRLDGLGPKCRFKAVGETRLGECAGTRYMEAGKHKDDRFAVGFDVDLSSPLYQIEIDYPDDAFRTMDVIVQDAAGESGDYTMQCGVATGREFPNTGRILTHRVLYWPRSGRCAAIFMTARDNARAAVAAVRVFRVKNGRLPVAIPERQPSRDGFGRHLGIYFEDPAMTLDFSVPRNASDAEGLDMMIDRMAAVMKFCGEDLLAYPGSWYQGLIKRGEYNARSHANDFLSAFYMKFDREGLSLMPTINRHNILSTPTTAVTPETIADGSLNGTEVAVMDDGRPNPGWHGTPPVFCIAHPRVQESILADVDALVAQGAAHGSFKGICLHLTKHSMLWWGGAECGYNDYALEAFARERRIDVRIDGNDPLRGKAAAEWLRKNAWNQWIDWRCDVLAEFYAKIDSRLKAARPDLRLRLDSRVNVGARDKRFDDPDYERSMAREAGLDVAKMQSRIPDVVIVETLSPAASRIHAREQYPSDGRFADEMAAFDRVRTLNLLGGAENPQLVLHDAYFENPCGRTKALDSDWLRECRWRVSTINPGGINAMSHFVKPLRFHDVLGIDKGGFLVGSYGMEPHLAAFARSFRALPPIVMADLPCSSDAVKVRAAVYGGRSYFYVVNTSGEAVSLDVVMPDATTDLSGGETYAGRLVLSLRPYELRSFAAPSGVPKPSAP